MRNHKSEERTEGEAAEEEINMIIKNLKKKKATGQDRIPNKAWTYRKEKIVKSITKCINNIQKGKKIPEEWKRTIKFMQRD